MADYVQSLLGSLTIALGGIAGLLAVLDWTLPREKKNWIRDKASTLWIWLSYQQTLPYIRKLQTPLAFDIFISFGALFVLVASIVYILNADATKLIGMLAFLIVLIPVVILFFTRERLRRATVWLTRGNAGWRILARGVSLFIVVLVVAVLLTKGYDLLYADFPNHPFTFFPAGIVVAIAAFAAMMILYGLLFLVGYIIGIYLTVLLFKVSEFIVLRVVEYDKGPVLGLAALLTGVGTILKALAK